MSYVNWNLDTEEKLDAYDPLGSIILVGESGKIEEQCTYLDGFFEALIEGVKKIEIGKLITIDPLIEPDDIEFDYRDQLNLKINYGSQQVIITNTTKFTEDFKKAVKDLVKTLDDLAEQAGQKKRKLIRLRSFLTEDLADN
ncbi:MAG: hypothetical protein AB4057_12035 [Crocosphaera sp.]